MDNVFVISLIFGYFAIPAALQHRVLLIGVALALVLRSVLIVVGAADIAQALVPMAVCGSVIPTT